jgi:hypothetical protein
LFSQLLVIHSLLLGNRSIIELMARCVARKTFVLRFESHEEQKIESIKIERDARDYFS